MPNDDKVSPKEEPKAPIKRPKLPEEERPPTQSQISIKEEDRGKKKETNDILSYPTKVKK